MAERPRFPREAERPRLPRDGPRAKPDMASGPSLSRAYYAVEPGGGNVADREPRPPSPRFRLSDVACGLLLLWWSHADPDYHTGCGKYSTIVCERRAVCGAHVSARIKKMKIRVKGNGI